MNTLNLIDKSFCISCDHIRKLNEDYKNYNDAMFKKQFTCKNLNNDKQIYDNGIYNSIPSDYISKKTCYNRDLNDKDEYLWELMFSNNYNNLNNTMFNQNTRRKTKLS